MKNNITRAIRSLIISLSALWSISSAAIEPYPVVIDCTDALSYQLPLNSEGEPTMNTSVCQWETGTGSVPYLQVVASVTTKQSEIIFPTNELNKHAYYNIYVVTTPAKDKELPCWFRVRHSEWDEETGSFTSSDTYFTNPNPITADSDVPNADLIIKQAHNEQFFVAGATKVDTILIQSAFQVATPAANLIVSSCGPSNSSTREIIYTRTLALHKIIMVPYATAEEAATHVGEIPQSFDLPQPINGLYYDFNDDGTCQIVAGPIKPQGEITIPETIEHEGQNYKVNSICSFAFYNLGITSLTIPDNIKEVGAYAFINCKKLKEIAINSPELVLSNYAFESTSDYVEELYINIPSVPKNSTGWSKLQKLVLGDAVKKVEAGAFLDSKELSLLEIGEQVDTIYNNTFLGCYELDSISFGSNLKFIDVYAFSSPYNLRAVSIKAQNPPNISTNILSDYNVNNTTLYVPEGRRIYYLAAKVWRDFKKIIAPDDAGENDENILYPTIALDRKWETRYTLEDGSHVSTEFSVDDLTVIDGKIYGIVPARNRNFSNSYSKLNASIDYAQADTLFYRQKDKKVFYLFPDISEEVLLFDYGLNVGDEYVNPLGERFYVVETNIFDKYAEHLYYYNEEEKPLALRLVSEDGMKEDVWIEGIGSREWGLVPPYMAKSLTNLEASPVKATTYHAYRATDYAGWVDQLLDIDEEKYKLVHFTYTPASGSSTYIVTKFVGNELQIRGTIATVDENNPNVLELLITDDNLIAYNFSYLHPHTYTGLAEIDIDIRIPGFKAGEYKIMYGEDDVINLVCEGADDINEYPTIVHSYRDYYSRLGEYGNEEILYETIAKTKDLLKHWDMYYHTGHGTSKIWTYYVEMSDTLIDNEVYTPVTISKDTLFFRQMGDEVYWRRSDGEEYLILDYGLNEGEIFYSPVSGTYIVTKIEYADEVSESESNGYKQWRYKNYASFFGTRSPKIIYLSNYDNDQKDIWIEGYGSIYWGIMPMNYIYYVNALPYEPTASHIIMASDLCSTISFEINEEDYKRIFFEPEDIDYEKYYQEANANDIEVEDYVKQQIPWSFTFEDDTLCITGIKELNCIPTYAECFIKGDVIDVNIAQQEDWWYQPECLTDRIVNVRIPGFKPGVYEIGIDGKEYHTVTCGVVEYTPFVAENKIWKYAWSKSGSLNELNQIDYFYFDKDTIVNPVDEKICKKWMHKSMTLNNREIEYIGAVYEEGKQVYLYRPNQAEALRLYDFATHVGDSVLLYNTKKQENEMCSIMDKYTQSIEYINGIAHDFYYVQVMFPDQITDWIEGIGKTNVRPDKNLAEPGWGMTVLMTCIANNDTIYDLSNYKNINESITSYWEDIDEDDPEVKRETLDFTHVIKTKPTSPLMMATPTLLRAEYNDIALFIHPEGMTGQYQISIRKDNGSQDHFASIYNLGNLQSIDVNLAGYPEGEYTITVENDQELFTAHFVLPLDGTGINEIENEEMRNGENENAIYDLSGRKVSGDRISNSKIQNSKLQKGIYIQSGRKVVKK